MSPATTTYERLVAERPPKAIQIEQEYHDRQRILSRFLAKPDDQPVCSIRKTTLRSQVFSGQPRWSGAG